MDIVALCQSAYAQLTLYEFEHNLELEFRWVSLGHGSLLDISLTMSLRKTTFHITLLCSLLGSAPSMDADFGVNYHDRNANNTFKLRRNH